MLAYRSLYGIHKETRRNPKRKGRTKREVGDRGKPLNYFHSGGKMPITRKEIIDECHRHNPLAIVCSRTCSSKRYDDLFFTQEEVNEQVKKAVDEFKNNDREGLYFDNKNKK